MKSLRNFLAIAAVTVLTACAGSLPTPQTPAQTVYSLQGAYAAALSVEVNYSKLPKCQPQVVKLCSTPEVVKKVRTASDVAWNAIKAAQGAVRTPGYGEELVSTALTTAGSALKAYTDITNTLTVE